MRPSPRKVLVLSASRGLAPREDLESLLLKLGRIRPLMEPRRGPQAGKSGYPRSQDADTYGFENYVDMNKTHPGQ